MTKRLEEELDLMPASQFVEPEEQPEETESYEIAEISTALTNAEKIDQALRAVQGIETHDADMDSIAADAINSYRDLMEMGLNVSDRDAGPIFDNAAKMLKTALEAKDSKVNSKLKQIDLMIKKARLDQQASKTDPDDEAASEQVFNRNDLLKMLREE